VAEILAQYGIEPHEYSPVVNALRKNPQAWLDFMMRLVSLMKISVILCILYSPLVLFYVYYIVLIKEKIEGYF